MEKMGESQIINFFTNVLVDYLKSFLTPKYRFAIGDFSGKQDREFADFFAGTDSVNILIEFKEKKSEYKDECHKVLRKKLCEELTNDIAIISRDCHFIGWGQNKTPIEVELNPYIDIVCSLWNKINFLRTPKNYQHIDFIKEFKNGSIGVDYETFVKYIEHLNSLANRSNSGGDIPFKSLLYSRDSNGMLIANRFETLNQLKMLIDMEPPTPDNDYGISPG